MAARAAIRDVGRALDRSYADVDRIAKLIPQKPGTTLKDLLDEGGDLKEIYDGTYEDRQLIDYALKLEGMPRHASVHAAGVVITKEPLHHYLPLATSGDTPITQFDMDTVAALGLLKFDFLAIRYLTILSDAERAVQKHTPAFSLDTVPMDDEATFKLLSEGRTEGVFQLESAGIKRLLSNMRPRSLEDVMVVIALYRPGPMDSIGTYLNNRAQPGKIEYKLPQLQEILEDTSGCIIYQEQVMQICRKVAGFSYGKADSVRKAMSKKKPELLEQMRSDFLRGAKEHFVDVKIANELFDDMASFAKYAFNKAHAAAYAVTSYRTAYMKAHYPGEYTSALLTSVMGNHGKTAEYIEDAASMGVHLLPPDINESNRNFSVTEGGIRYGLCGIKGIGDGFVRHIQAQRKGRPFASFADFAQRMIGVELNRQQAQALISVGAFDGMGNSRAELLAGLDKFLQMLSDERKRNLDGQTDLFGDVIGGSSGIDHYRFDPMPEFTAGQRLRMEKEFTGLCLSGSLLDDYTKHLAMLEPAQLTDILRSFDEEGEAVENAPYKDGQTVTVAGVWEKITRKSTKNGDAMAFAQLEDKLGAAELIIFPKQFERYAPLVSTDRAVWASATVSVKDDQGAKLIVNELGPLVSDEEWSANATIPMPSRRQNVRQEKASVAPASAPTSMQSAPTEKLAEKPVEEKRTASPRPALTKAPSQPMQTPVASAPQAPAAPVASAIPNAEQKLYLRVESMDSPNLRKAMLLCEIFSEGRAQVILYDKSCGKYVRTNGVSVLASPFVLRELGEILGAENVVLR